MKKLFTILSGTMLLGVCLFSIGCTNSDKKAESDVLRMGIMQGKSEIPIIIAKENGYFDEEGLNVEISSFQGPNYRDAAVQAGEVDGVVTDIMTVLTYSQSGFPMTMTSDMNEDFKLISASGLDIDSAKDFNGKNIVVVKNYLTHYVMDAIAEKNNITYDIETIPQIPLRLEALRNGLVGGAVLGEPQASMLTKDGINIIADAEDDYGIEVGTIAFNEEFINNNANNMAKFYKAYNKAIDYLNNTNVNEYIALVENYGISTNIAPYLETEEGKFEYAKDFSKEQFNDVLAWTKKNGVITETFDFNEITNFDFIK